MTSLATVSLLGPLCAFLSSLTWAIGTSKYSALSRHTPAFVINFHRALIGFPLFAALALLAHSSFSETIGAFFAMGTTRLSWFTVSIICSYAFGDVLFLWSTRSLGTPGALAICSTYPLWSAWAGWVFRGETLTSFKAAGLVVAVCGTVLVILSGYRLKKSAPRASTPGEPRPRLLDRYGVGITLAFITSLFWALNAFSTSQATQGVHITVAGTIRMLLAMVLCPLIGIALAGKSRPQSLFMSKPLFRSALWVFLVEGFLGALLFTYGLANSPLAVGAVLTSLAPVLSLPFAWWLGGERLSKMKISGVMLVVAGVWLLV